MLRPLPLRWPVGLPFWLAYVWAFTPEFRIVGRAARSEAARGPQDRGSLRVILLGQSIASMCAFLLAIFSRWGEMGSEKTALYVAGVSLLVAGSLLRRHCFRMLGGSFTGAVQVAPDQVVVDRGAYHLVRHPSYTAGVIMLAGIGLALGNWGSFALNSIATAAAYLYRANVEEEALVATLGSAYEEYRRRTWRFVPLVY